MALAESYVLTGATPAAVDQLNMARKAKDVSFYDQAVIDARERELQQKQKEEKQEKKDRGEGFAADGSARDKLDTGPRLKIETGNGDGKGKGLGDQDFPSRKEPMRLGDPLWFQKK